MENMIIKKVFPRPNRKRAYIRNSKPEVLNQLGDSDCGSNDHALTKKQ